MSLELYQQTDAEHFFLWQFAKTRRAIALR